MSQIVNAWFSVLFLVLGAVTILAMLEFRKKPQNKVYAKLTSKAHKIGGYLFVALFFLMYITMIYRVSTYQEEFSSRVIFHIVLSMILAPLLIMKVLIARRYKFLTANQFAIGIIVFIIAFTLNSLTLGYYFLYRSQAGFISISKYDTDILDVDIGRRVVNSKCGKCHTLERVYRAYKSDTEWTKTVNEMAELDEPNIKGYEIKQAIHFLVEQQKKRSEDGGLFNRNEVGKTFISRKCGTCHDLERVFLSSKSKQEWETTINRMIKIGGSPTLLTETEKHEMIAFLTQQKGEPQSETAQTIFRKKCSVCHDLKTVLTSGIKTQDEWRTIVADMQKKAPDVIADKDIKPIVDFLTNKK